MSQKHVIESKAFAAFQAGNEKGLSPFFDRYYSLLTLYAKSLTGNTEIAKEIASEAFVKLWNARESITEPRNIKPFLYRVVYNASVDYLREQQTKAKRKQAYEQLLETSERAVVDKMIEAETYNRLYSLLQNLTPRSRQIFQLFYFERKAIKEIAQELGISVNTVKTHKLQALQTLKQKQDLLLFFILCSPFFI